MCEEMPKCPYGCQTCPGSSDEAWVFFDEDAWALDQWQCEICRCEYRIANNIDSNNVFPEDDHSCSESEELEPAF